MTRLLRAVLLAGAVVMAGGAQAQQYNEDNYRPSNAIRQFPTQFYGQTNAARPPGQTPSRFPTQTMGQGNAARPAGQQPSQFPQQGRQQGGQYQQQDQYQQRYYSVR